MEPTALLYYKGRFKAKRGSVMKSRLLKKLLAGFMALTLSFSSMGISSFAYEGERSTEAEDESSDAVLSEEENASEG